MVNCPTCGTPSEAGRKFCAECGTQLTSVCGACGAANSPTARFCGDCGNRLGGDNPGDVPPPDVASTPGHVSSPAAVAERRFVTVLFADMVGFTALAEGRDAEAVRELLTRYFDLARDVIERYGGSIEKFIGDAVMAVWGAPVAHEDDAERGVRAALELVDAVRDLGPGIQARAGLVSGEAAVTLGATGQGMVAGDIVNTASRLQSVAAPGSVLVGEATYRAASEAIAFESAGEHALKGKELPLAAWTALRVVSKRKGLGRSDRLEAPFVGRESELRLLKDLFHATAREQRARLVSITGQAGIGKSRLAWEFLKYVDGVVEGVWWHDGRSPAYGEGVTFWALGEMIRSRAGLLETDDAATTRTRIAEMVELHVPDADERTWIEPALLALLGVGDAPSGGRDELFRAWRTFFERLASTGPVGLLFEDLQWADAGLLDFIDHLLEWSRGVPILIITLARPDLLERRADWGAGRRNFLALGLEPLTGEAMRDLLAGLVPGLPESTVRSIVARADGIPLYAVETIRMLVSDGRLREVDGRYEPAGELGDLAVPETLQALIAARLDALAAGGSGAAPGRRRARAEFHARRLGCGVRRGTGRRRETPARPEPCRARRPGRGPALSRARHVRLRASAHPGGRLRDPGQAGPARASSGGGAVLRRARRGRTGRTAGRPLPRRLAGSAGRTRRRCRGDPGAARADRSGGPSDEPRFTRRVRSDSSSRHSR